MVELETLSYITEESSALVAMLTLPLVIFELLNMHGFKITGAPQQLLIYFNDFLSNVKIKSFLRINHFHLKYCETLDCISGQEYF